MIFIASVPLEDLAPSVYPNSPLDELALGKEKKQLLKKAVDSFQKQTLQDPGMMAISNTTRLTSDGSERLLLFFHGPPGTGKSMAARCLANHVNRPLFVVVPGGIATSESGYIDRLKSVRRLAVSWDCVVFIDNIDVILEIRIKSDLARNALVTGRIMNQTGLRSLARLIFPRADYRNAWLH